MMPRKIQNVQLAVVCGILLAIITMTVFAPWLAPYDPTQIDMTNRLAVPCREHLLALPDRERQPNVNYL